MSFWVTVALWAGLFVLNKWIIGKSPAGNKERRTQDDSPTVRDGVTIPIWYGKCRFDAPNLVWNSPRRSVHDPSPAIDQGAYAANMMFVLGIPGGVLSPNFPTYDRKITWDDLEINGVRYVRGGSVFGEFYTESVDGVDYDLSTFTETEGIFSLRTQNNIEGVVGKLIVRDGFHDTGPYGCGEFAHATGKDTELWPAYRYQTTMLAVGLDGPHTPAEIDADDFRKHYIYGRSAEIPSILITMTNPCAQMIGATELLPVENGNPNPVAVLYDVLTNDWARVGLPAAKIDQSSFTTAASILDSEGHSWGGFLTDPQDATDIVREIMAQINGVIFEDVETRLLRLKLVRFDYTPASLPLFDESNISEVVQFSTSTFGESHNQVRVTYTDANDNFGTRTAVAQDLANITSQGGRVRAVTIDFPHIRNQITAQQVAARELNEVSLPLATLKLRVNRDGYERRPGDPIRVSWSELNYTEVVFRVQHVDYGQLGSEDIILDVVQDVFAQDLASMGNPTVPFPSNPILPIQERTLTEAPRYILQQAVFSGFNTNADDPRLWYLATPAQADSSGYTIYEYDDDFVRTVADLIFSPHPYPARALVNATYSRSLDPYDTSTGLQIKSVSNTSVLRNITDSDVVDGGQNLVIVGNEIMAYETFTDLGSGIYRLNNVWRGLFDTPCVQHFGNERVYFLSDALGITAQRYVGRFARMREGTTANARFLAHLGGTAQNPDDYGVETDRLVARNRQALPLPPADLVVDGGKGGVIKDEGFDATWRERNRLNVNVVRGDAAAEDGGAVQHLIKVQKIGPLFLTGNLTQVDTAPAFGDGGFTTTTVAGHGQIDVAIASFDTSISLECWDPVRVTMQCPPWRNLLANSRFADPLSTYTPEWVIVTGADRDDDPAHQHGDSEFYITANTINEEIDVSQTVDITGYFPERMTANLTFFLKLTAASVVDEATVTLSALDASNSVLTSTVFGPSVPTTQWTRQSLTITNLPANTAKLRVRIQGVPEEDQIIKLAFADFTLRVGQMSSQLLVNGNFESGGGSLSSWTTVSGSWTVVTTSGYDGNVVATNNGSGTNELRQDVTFPAGFEYGTAIVSWAQADNATGDGDTGQVILEALDGSSVVVATASSTAIETSPSDVFVARQLELENIPPTAVTLRTRVRAVTNAASDVLFDGFFLRVHKELDPDQRLDGEMRVPKTQRRPLDRGDWVEAFPTVPMPDYGMYTHANFVGGAMRGRLGIEPALNAPSGLRTGKFVGLYNGEDETVTGPVVELQSTDDGLVAVEKNLYGNFGKADSFSVLAIFRNRLPAVSACGLVGRFDSFVDNVGWSLELNGSGFVQARIEGLTTSATAARGTAIKDGHPWMAWLIHDADTEELHCVDPSGTTTVSTAGIGEFKTNSANPPFTIGRCETSQTCLDGQIDVYMWRQAITPTQAASIWDHGETPTIAVTSSARTGAVVLPIGQDSDGELLASFHQTQLPIGKEEGTNLDFGVAMNLAMTSLVTTSNFRDTTAWPRDGGAAVTVDRPAPLGFLDGMSIVSTNAAGVRSANFTLSATTTVKVTWWARTGASAHNARLELRNSSNVVKGTIDFPLTSDWIRYDFTFTTWDASTATGHIKFYGSDTGSGQQAEIAGPIYVSQSTFVPVAVPYGGAVGASELTFSASGMTQYNSEGEIYLEAFGKESSPGVQRDIITVDNGTNNNDARTIRYNSSSNAQLVHNDGSAASNNATASGTGWDVLRVYRGRWNRAGLIEAAATFSAIDRAGTSTTGRSAIWTQSATGPARVRLLASNLLIPRFVLFAREVNKGQPI